MQDVCKCHLQEAPETGFKDSTYYTEEVITHISLLGRNGDPHILQLPLDTWKLVQLHSPGRDSHFGSFVHATIQKYGALKILQVSNKHIIGCLRRVLYHQN